MKTIRIFISSPGDVAHERDFAKSVIEELRRRYAGRLDLKAVLWEDLPLTADTSFQQGIDLVLSERGVDIAIFILWSRLGTPVGAVIHKPDGTEYRSGTEREWDLMWQAWERSGGQRPKIIVYTRRDEPSFDERLRGVPTDEKERLVRQKKLVEQFITEEFRDTDRGTNIRAHHGFDRPATFAQRLRVHLQELLDELAGGDLAAPVWDIEKKGPPFLGLDAFDFEHAAVFFGREDEIVAVRQLLREQAKQGCAFVLMAGASGSGKSSLARAGVLPAIAAHEIDSEVAGWRAAILTPGEDNGGLLLTLGRALGAENALPALRSETDWLALLANDLARDPEMVCRRVLRPALETAKRRERLIVLVDQLEELFTDPRIAAEAREAFVRALEALARSGFAWVLATVRSDFYGQCQSLDGFVRMKDAGQFFLVPPGADALDRLIRQPAVLAGVRFEERGDRSLAEVILRDASAHRELLPQLEYLLHRLCAERTAEGVLTFGSYEGLGGVEGALAQRADAVIAELQPSEAALDALLSALVTLSGDEQESFVRRRVPRAELERDGGSRTLVARLIDERLLTSSAPPGGEAVVTVAHEALFRVWSAAVAWLGRNREFLRLRANVTQSFTRWRDAQEDDSLLLPTGLLLEEARRLLTLEAGRLEQPVRGYVESSMARAREQKERAEREIARNREQLHAASMADYAVAVQRIEKDGKWSEGVAHLARALDWEPGNGCAAARLYATLSIYAAENQGLPRVVLQHEDKVRSAQFSADGARIVTASEDKTGRVWDAATGEPLGEPLRHENDVLSAQFSPDGARVVTASGDGTARLWDAASGKPLSESLRHEGSRVRCAQFSPDGSRVVTAGDDKTARLWDAATGKPVGEPLRHERAVWHARFSPDGSRVVTAGDDKTARLWDAATGRPLGEPLRHEGEVRSAQFSPDGARVVTASEDFLRKTGEARVWDAATGQPLGEPLRHEGVVPGVQFSPDGSRVVTASEDQTARLWDAATGRPLGKPLRHDDGVRSAQFSPDGSRVVTASSDRTARVWDAATGEPLGGPLYHKRSVYSAQFSPDGMSILTASSDQTARVWDAATGKPLGEPLRHPRSVYSARFSPDGARLVTAGDDKTARLWDVATGRPLGEALRHGDRVRSAHFSPDGSRILTASSDRTARVWDAATGKTLGEPLRHEDAVRDAQFSGDGSRIVTASGDAAQLWDAATGVPVGERLRHKDGVNSAQFNPEGSRIVTASEDKTARIWDAATGLTLGDPLRHEGWVASAQFSADGARIVTASGDRTARIWDAATGKPLTEPLRHKDKVRDAHFSPDGSCVVTACWDQTVRLWDASTGKPMGEPLGHEDKVWSAHFSPDGSRLVTVCEDHTARLWDVANLLHPALPVPEWMRGRTRSVAGFGFSEDGELETLSAKERLAVFQQPVPGEDAWANLARWLARPAAERTFTSESHFTWRQIAERERDFGSRESLEAAVRFDPTVPLARLLLAGVLVREDAGKEPGQRDPGLPQRAAFLRDYDLKRLPDDPALWARAVKALHEQQDDVRMREALLKLEALGPERAAALKRQWGL